MSRNETREAGGNYLYVYSKGCLRKSELRVNDGSGSNIKDGLGGSLEPASSLEGDGE